MALQTKTLTANGSKGHHKFTLKVNEETTSGNSSFMSYSFTIAPIQNGWNWSGWGSSISYSITVGGNVYTGTIPSYNGSSTVTLKSGSNIEIAHNTDGTKTINISFTVTDNTGQSYTCGSASSSSTFKLMDLHKPPVVSISSVTEQNSLLTSVSGATIVNLLSIKRFVLSIQTFDSATITADNIDVTEQGTLPLKSTISISGNTVTIDIDFNEQSLTPSSLTALKTKIMFFIMDSKGGVNITYTPEYDVIPYQKPNLIQTSSSVKRNGQLSGKAIMNLVGTFYGSSVGTKSNSVTLSYKYWKTNVSEPSTYFPITGVTTSDNVINVTNWNVAKNGTPITDVDSNSSYYFKVKMVDAFSKESYITLNVPIGKYIMAKFKDRVDFMEVTINNSKYLSNVGDGIKAYCSTSQTVSPNVSTIVNINTVDYNNSSKLSLSNNAIYIGENIHTILVNCRYTASNATNNNRYIYVYKNGEPTSFNAKAYSGTMETTTIIPVQENDYIQMVCHHEHSSTISINSGRFQTFLQVTILG